MPLAGINIRSFKHDQELIGYIQAGDFSGLVWPDERATFYDFDGSRCWHKFNGLEFAQANLKLWLDHIIFNMGPGFLCPAAAAGFCKVQGCCYNKKGEARAAVRLYRLRQLIQWRTRPAGDYVQALRAIRANDSRIKYVRFNESSDLWGPGCLDKLSEISEGVKKSKLIVYGFSARPDLVEGVRALPFKLRLSGYEHPHFPSTMVIEHPEELPAGWFLCPGKCRRCRVCKHTDLNVAFIKH